MLTVQGVSLQFGDRKLFDNVNISFSDGSCYGLIGANGSGKSSFIKILAGDIESTTGQIVIPEGKRLSVLRQDQFAFDQYSVLMTVIMGHQRLYEIMSAKDAIYAKPDFSDEDGLRASELEAEFAELDGWNAESDAARLLGSLGIPEDCHELSMKQLEAGLKVRVLLAQALFGNPDILLLDEPTNQLDVDTCMWLEEFLADFKNTAIVVSHDRHFLDKVCTHIADIDFGKIQLYPGNYSFWFESSQLAQRQRSETNKKVEDKRKELEQFIARFSANAAKSRQATSRKKILEKLNFEDIKPSSRKYPYIGFQQERDAGNELLRIDHLTVADTDEQIIFKDVSIEIEKGEKVAFVGQNDRAKTALFDTITGKIKPRSGEYKWGASATYAYYAKDYAEYFDCDLNIVDWLRQYSSNVEETFVRGFLGRMLFTGEESQKSVRVLSGGEKVRCLLARMMLMGSNVVILDEPTNHLDLESITALNKGLKDFKGTVLMASHDHELIQTVCDRVIEIGSEDYIDKPGMQFDEYLADETIRQRRHLLYTTQQQSKA